MHPPGSAPSVIKVCTIWYMSDQTAKETLLAAVVGHFVRDGLGEQSLRQIALAVGTSHRMLLYHFGSKDGLLVEVARSVEETTREQFSDLRIGPDRDTADLITQMWRYVADPDLGDFERLFFALYGRGLQGDEQLRPLMGENIESWLEANEGPSAELGIDPHVARVHARLGLAVIRGLLLDLLATGDDAEVGAALQIFADRYSGRWWEMVGVTVPAS